MKKILLLLVAASLSMGISAQTVRLNGGQSISIRTTKYVSSKTKNPDITAIVDRDVRDITGEKVLIRRGTPVEVTLNSERAKGVGKPGYLDVKCLSTRSVDGQYIALLGGLRVEGDNKEGAALGCGLGLGLTVLFPEGLFLLCIKGKNVEIPSDTIIQNVVVNDNYLIRAEQN